MEKRPWLRHLDYKFPWTINYPSIPAYQILRDSANTHPDKACTSFYGTEITMWEMYLKVIKMANALLELGIQKGDRVGLLLPNCPQFVHSYFSILQIGAIVVNLNPIYTYPELKHCIDITEVKGLITFDALIPMIKPLTQAVDIPVVIVTKLTDFVDGAGVSTKESLGLEDGWHHYSELLESSTNKVPPRPNLKNDDPALIQFTGGTTGTPKGATLTQRNLVAATFQVVMAGASLIDSVQIERRNVLSVLPLFHVYGEICCLMYGIHCCATMILLPRFDIEEVMQTIENVKEITFWPAVPTMLTAFLSHPKASEMDLGRKFMFVNNGAAPASLELIEKAKDLNVYMSEGWGMSETTSLGISNPVMGVKKPLSIGVPYPDNDIRVVDPDTLEDVKQGERGEIWIKGPTVMSGYWNNPEETINQLRDGWLRTGDVAYQDEDGYVFIVDRTKDVILAGGYNIYPRDIDEVLFKHPKVKDVITVGIPDEYRGETVKSFVQLVEGQTATEDELREFCREHLAAYKVPRLIEFKDELPRTTVGKALRRILRDEAVDKA
ncbi:MAG: long-chain fatty acid--CoA ligase [Syntrophomonadaceae bacterium]|nr:long-chain fatty acid--CoA ligase [Syntrophomonadaceae bacterium]